VFTNIQSDYCLAVQPLDLALSDHIGILLNWSVNIPDSKPTLKTIRPITNYGKFLFYHLISNNNWDFIDSDIDPDDKFTMFLNNIVFNYHTAFPERQHVHCSNRPTFSVNWFTPELQGIKETVHFLKDAYNLHKTPQLKRMFSTYRNKYSSAVKNAKIKANELYIQKNHKNSRAMWQVINQYRPSSSNDAPSLSPNQLNYYFANIAENLIQSLPTCSLDPIKIMNNDLKAVDKLFNFREVTFNEVRTCIDNLKSSTTKDIYGMNHELLKQIKEVIISPFTKLMNYCIRTDIFPNCLKRSIVIPIFKKGDRNDCKNYRPISLLPVFSEIFEKLLLLQIVNFFNKNNLFSNAQFGFRRGLSTSSAVLSFFDNIVRSFENNNHYKAIFLDLSKAFDTVSHDILIKKLGYYKFSSSSISMITSYLSNRTQKVKVNGVFSEKSRIIHGVPQGSILDPVLFLIYINDLPSYIPQADTVLYADDTTLGLSEASAVRLNSEINSILSKVRDWLLSNKLHLNNEKTVNVSFTLKKSEISNDETESAKFLGIFVDSHLLWHKHIDYLASKICKNIFLLRNLSNCVSQKTLRSAYFALIQSQLQYCITLWGHSPASIRLFKLQRRAIRIMANTGYRTDCRLYFNKLKILTLPCLYILRCLQYIKNNPDQYKKLKSFHDYSTRKSDYSFDVFRLNRSRHGLNFYSIKFYNVLPHVFRKMSPDLFKMKIEKYLLAKSFYSVEEYLNDNFSYVLTVCNC
jgi:hypothetical protein